MAIFVLAIVAALLAVAPDAFSMMSLAIPMRPVRVRHSPVPLRPTAEAGHGGTGPGGDGGGVRVEQRGPRAPITTQGSPMDSRPVITKGRKLLPPAPVPPLAAYSVVMAVSSAARLRLAVVGRRRRRRRGVQTHLRLLMRVEARPGRDQVAQDDVLLQADQVVHLAGQRRLGQHLRRLLERRRRDEALRLHRRLRDAQQLRRVRRRRRLDQRRQAPCPPPPDAARSSSNASLRDDLALLELRVAGVLDLHALASGGRSPAGTRTCRSPSRATGRCRPSP